MHSFAHHTVRHRPSKTLAIHQARCWQRGRWPQAKMHINIKHRRRAMTPSTRTVETNKRRTEERNSGSKTFLELYSCACGLWILGLANVAWLLHRKSRRYVQYSHFFSPNRETVPWYLSKPTVNTRIKKMHTWDNVTIHACLSKLQWSLPAIAAFLLAVCILSQACWATTKDFRTMVAFRQRRSEMGACSDLYALTDELLLRLREASLSLAFNRLEERKSSGGAEFSLKRGTAHPQPCRVFPSSPAHSRKPVSYV